MGQSHDQYQDWQAANQQREDEARAVASLLGRWPVSDDKQAIYEWATSFSDPTDRFNATALLAALERLEALVEQVAETLKPFTTYLPECTYANLDRARLVYNLLRATLRTGAEHGGGG